MSLSLKFAQLTLVPTSACEPPSKHLLGVSLQVQQTSLPSVHMLWGLIITSIEKIRYTAVTCRLWQLLRKPCPFFIEHVRILLLTFLNRSKIMKELCWQKIVEIKLYTVSAAWHNKGKDFCVHHSVCTLEDRLAN